MSAVASVLALILFLAFASAGVQKVIFNPLTSSAASHLGFTKSAYRRIGILEIVGAIALVVGLTATGSSIEAIVNEVAAASLVVLMGAAVFIHRRHGDHLAALAPALVLGVAALAELAFRLAA